MHNRPLSARCNIFTATSSKPHMPPHAPGWSSEKIGEKTENSGANAMITFLDSSSQKFSAKKSAFFLLNQSYDQFVTYVAVIWVKIANCFSIFFRWKYFKNNNIVPTSHNNRSFRLAYVMCILRNSQKNQRMIALFIRSVTIYVPK
jgi:hypothetical protein